MKILVTGAAGFIGFHLVEALLQRNDEVVGIDNLNDYYDVNLKLARLKETGIPVSNIENGVSVKSSLYPNYEFVKLDILERDNLSQLFAKHNFDIICHLAAQAGVRYSIDNPFVYVESNVSGFLNILECCRKWKIDHLLYASSSSVYGHQEKMPLSTDHQTDNPISLYAATKKSNELMAYTYSHLYRIKTTGLRFFTAYGPWARPDMALYKFAASILENRPIQIYGDGEMVRDFTYIVDLIDRIIILINKSPSRQKDNVNLDLDSRLYKIYNIGSSSPAKLSLYVRAIEEAIGKPAIKEYLPIQPGDVFATYADMSDFDNNFGPRPVTSLDLGIGNFVAWYKKYHSL